MTYLNSTNSADHLRDVVAQMELRAEHGTGDDRRIVQTLRQLTATAAGAWPADSHAGFELAIRLLNLCASLNGHAATQSAVLQLAELALGRLGVELRYAEESPETTARVLLDAWHAHTVLPRDLVAEVIVDTAPAPVVDALSRLLLVELEEDIDQLHPPDFTASLVRKGRRPTHRDFLLFHARVQAAAGRLADSMATLREVDSDATTLETTIELLAEDGQYAEAIDRLRKAIVVADDTRSLREQLYELLRESGDHRGAHEELFTLLRESGDVLYWNILVHELTDSNPGQLTDYRHAIAQNTPGLHVEILIHEGDVGAVVTASRGKNFNAAELWRIADYLRTRRPGAAIQLYLRSFTLAGATSRTRQECEALGARLEDVLPFFEENNAAPRLKKAAKESLARHKKNIPLQREFERVFGPTFRR